MLIVVYVLKKMLEKARGEKIDKITYIREVCREIDQEGLPYERCRVMK